MGQINPPENAILFAAVFSNKHTAIEQGTARLQEKYGDILFASKSFLFDFTDYYKAEMGENLQKEIFLFNRIIDPSEIPEIKLVTNKIEKALSPNGQRDINMDPGYVSLAKVVLATTKNYSHRIYVGQGIYAEVTLSWRKGSFIPSPWTYPDYKTDQVIDFFNKCRHELKKKCYIKKNKN